MIVDNYIAYHLSLCDNEIGSLWPIINRSYSDCKSRKTEEILDSYRNTLLILTPRSRSLFVCSDNENVENWYLKKFKSKFPYLYTLRLTGELNWVDAEEYEKLFAMVGKPCLDESKIKEIAMKYWDGINSNSSMYIEGLFVGDALILDKRLYIP